MDFEKFLFDVAVSHLRKAVPEPERKVRMQDVLRLWDACRHDVEVLGTFLDLYIESPAGKASDYSLVELLTDGELLDSLYKRAVETITQRKQAIHRSESLRKTFRFIDESTRSLQLLAETHMREAGFETKPLRTEAVLAFMALHLGVQTGTSDNILAYARSAVPGGGQIKTNANCFWCRFGWHVWLYSIDESGHEVIKCQCKQIFVSREAFAAHVMELVQNRYIKASESK